MSAIPRMLSIAREEATVLTTELATAARTIATEGLAAEARTASEAMNPAAVKQAAEMSAKESSEGPLLSHHLSHTTTFESTNLPSLSINSTAIPSITPSATSNTIGTIVGQALERDLGVTLKEAMSNAAGTGLEDQVDHFTDATKTLIKGRAPGEAVRLT
ncbi:hypothetical protein I312_106612 [Cryptococcus bacillisporus CA1280]|uniref:uncharacterized protein n=1 Tax=Cryptococcus bacillisporus CA1280 TaxID=1296109 RepID=UPI003366FC00